ncbi:MAG: contact-dependent growth inhibition system immunity protein [Pseudomonadota bacterium]
MAQRRRGGAGGARGGAARRHLSLERIERRRLPPPAFPSALVLTCLRLRAKPIGDFTTEDLRIMIAQRQGLAHLAPLAVERLEVEPLAGGDFHPGDLLRALIRTGAPVFDADPALARRAAEVCRRASALLAEPEPSANPKLAAAMAAEFDAFRARWGDGAPTGGRR